MTTSGNRATLAAACAFAVLLAATPLLAQNPTGTLTGRVSDQQGAALPGVTVTATSPSLQGSRVTTTGVNGDYKLAFMPPGTYQVTYELEGFKTSVREVKLSAAQTTPSDLALELGEVTEEIVVTGRQALISETGTGASTVTFEELDDLPVGRTLGEAVNLVPGVATHQGFGFSGAPSIAGAPTFENLFLVNGVVINENIRGDILPLFIEDAVQETTTAVTGISAEYGRFTGGVVNAITKSGGNEFDGSARVSFLNEDWEARTPLSAERVDDITEVYEATLGGFLWKDHIWFFGAGRDREIVASNQTAVTNIQFPVTDEERRLEGKLTVTPHPSHSLIGSYLEIERTRTGNVFGNVFDLRSVSPNREDPQEIKSVNYTGILTPNFFIEGQYSERDFIIGRGSGGVPDLIDGTVWNTRGSGTRYWAPVFCGSCEDQSRNNENALAKASYFLSTEGGGTHDFAAGYDTFEDSIFSVNHQSGSDFFVFGNNVVGGQANPVLDGATGSPYPVVNPATGAPWILWWAVFNPDLAQPSAFKTNSFYVNDRWQLNDKWSFNLGVRYDENDGTNSAGVKVTSDSKVSPRLGGSFDVKGDGDLVFNASYGTYVAAIASTGNVADGSSNGGAIGYFLFSYRGPAINVAPCTPNADPAAGGCVDAGEALRIMFDWYFQNGGTTDLSQINPNSPAFTPFSRGGFLLGSDIPGATTQIIGGIESPSVDEITFGLTKRLGTKGLVRADLVYREFEDFYGSRTDQSTGQVTTAAGPADLTLLGNFNRGLEREYQGLHTQFRYRFTDRFTLAGNYTLSNTEGNFNGETGGSGPVTSGAETYPEYTEASWNRPVGDLRVDQRHKLRVWGIYDLIDTAHHRLNVSLLQNFFSGQPYAANAGTLDPSDDVPDLGYISPPTGVTYFFTARDAFHTDDIYRTDLALNYGFVFNAWGREIEMFVQPEVINVFNEQGVIDPLGLDDNEGVVIVQQFDPFTETPVEGVHWRKDPNFGQPLNEDDFQDPRTFRFSVGFRF